VVVSGPSTRKSRMPGQPGVVTSSHDRWSASYPCGPAWFTGSRLFAHVRSLADRCWPWSGSVPLRRLHLPAAIAAQHHSFQRAATQPQVFAGQSSAPFILHARHLASPAVAGLRRHPRLTDRRGYSPAAPY
jgi:hypothetical protein